MEFIQISCSHVYKCQLLGTATFNLTHSTLKEKKQEMQCTYNAILSRVRVAVVVTAKQ